MVTGLASMVTAIAELTGYSAPTATLSSFAVLLVCTWTLIRADRRARHAIRHTPRSSIRNPVAERRAKREASHSPLSHN